MENLPTSDATSGSVLLIDKATKFRASVLACMARIDQVPPGWRPAYEKAMSALLALDCPQRGDVTLAGPFVEPGRISFLHSGADHCVQGVLRKTTTRLLARCELCGHAAKQRRLGIEKRSLCPECFAPRALRIGVRHLLGRLRAAAAADPRFPVATLPVPPLIEAVLDTTDWRKTDCQRQADGKLDVPVATLRLAEGTLMAMSQKLDKIVHGPDGQATDACEGPRAA